MYIIGDNRRPTRLEYTRFTSRPSRSFKRHLKALLECRRNPCQAHYADSEGESNFTADSPYLEVLDSGVQHALISGELGPFVLAEMALLILENTPEICIEATTVRTKYL